MANTEDISQTFPDEQANLFEQISWSEFIVSNVISTGEHQLLTRGHMNLELIIDSAADASAYAKVLLKLSLQSPSQLQLKQYVFSRIVLILGLGETDYLSPHHTIFSSKNVHLFANGGEVQCQSFLKAMQSGDKYLERSSSAALAVILNAYPADANITPLVAWICSKLGSSPTACTPALMESVRGAPCPPLRAAVLQAGGAALVGTAIRKMGRGANSQALYELCFVLWSLSLSCTDKIDSFTSGGVLGAMVDLMAACPSRKIIRMCIGTLRNLCASEESSILTEMLGLGLLKILETARQSNAVKLAADDDILADFQFVQDTLQGNFRELSTFERWSAEVTSGNLRWGIVHTEKFWRENAKFLENDNFALLKALIGLLEETASSLPHVVDPVVLCVALFDIGEFTRFYPNGRVVVGKLGGKDLVMKILNTPLPGSEGQEPTTPPPTDAAVQGDADIQKHSLQCISKLMVSNWEFLR